MLAKVSMSNIVSIEGLWLTLDSQAGPVDILRGIDLEILSGESVSITGPSGAGKTSLMMIIGGLERPTGGTVHVAGQLLNDQDEDTLARYRRDNIGIVFQSFHLIPTMSALENVAIPLELAGVPEAFDRASVELKTVGLEHRVDHYPGQLSGGEQQRVALARAMVTKPNLILADEPTGNLDGDNSVRIMELLFDLCEINKTTLVLITHQLDLAERCGRNVKLSDGVITANSAGDLTP